MIKDIIIHKRNTLGTQHARPSPSPRSSPQNTRQGDGLARHRAARRPSCSTPRSRCKAAATPSIEGKTPEISVPQARRLLDSITAATAMGHGRFVMGPLAAPSQRQRFNTFACPLVLGGSSLVFFF